MSSMLWYYSVLLRSSDGRIPGRIINFVYGLIFCCNAQGRGSLYMSSLVGILLFLRRSGRWQMPGLIINAVFGLVFCCTSQVWQRPDVRANYKYCLWFGFLLFLRRSSGGRMPGLITNVVFGFEFVVSAQVWRRADAGSAAHFYQPHLDLGCLTRHHRAL